MKQDIIADAFLRHEAVLRSARVLFADAYKAADLILKTVQAGGVVFTCGNGGSAADARHFAAEFTCRYKEDRRPLGAIVLGANASHVTAVGNDYTFEDTFSRELEVLGRTGDLFLGFTTSGSSKNILRAIDAAHAKRMSIILMTGEKGKALATKVDVCIAVPSQETARIQEVHELIYHAWCEYVDTALFPA